MPSFSEMEKFYNFIGFGPADPEKKKTLAS
jgi:hypothetical protein